QIASQRAFAQASQLEGDQLQDPYALFFVKSSKYRWLGVCWKRGFHRFGFAFAHAYGSKVAGPLARLCFGGLKPTASTFRPPPYVFVRSSKYRRLGVLVLACFACFEKKKARCDQRAFLLIFSVYLIRRYSYVSSCCDDDYFLVCFPFWNWHPL